MTSLVRPLIVLLVLGSVGATLSQGFYSTRYGKRGSSYTEPPQATNLNGNSYYDNRYGRSLSGLPEIKIRSSRFIGGSRYGKRGPSPITLEEANTDMTRTLKGDSFTCDLINLPNIYKCQRKRDFAKPQ